MFKKGVLKYEKENIYLFNGGILTLWKHIYAYKCHS